MVGKNLYKADSSCFKCHKTFDVEKKIIEGKGDSYGRHVAPSGEDKVLAFSTALVGDSKWIVAVSAPYSEVTGTIQRSMKFYSWLIISIFMTTSIVSVMLIFSYRKRVKAEELERHQKELERYAGDLERKVNKRTEELSTEKEKLNTIVSAIGSGIILLDLQGKIQWTNQTMKEIAGKDITGMSCEEICADCTIAGSYSVDDMQTEILLNLFGMKDRYFQVTTAPVKGTDGELHGYIRLVQDVTEMKKMEEQMMHSEKLASLGRLTAGITHEIGNPLTSVFSFVQILKEMEQDEFKKESLGTIYFHINRIADILKQLSGFSKTPPVELKPWKVNSLIESSLSLIQYDKRAKDITIVRDLASDIPEITTDGNQLSQVIVNIILNAVDAMPAGGTLTIRSRVKDQHIIVTFEDTGIGISQENIGRIFDPFFTTKEKGTGLGLAVSYSIIKKLNGSLSVESEVKKGSRFVITLPMNGAK
jgi:signal transduction histidine kinase